MQGAGTTRSIYEALMRIEQRLPEYDAVIVLRGGGSRMDLSAFDDYNLCVLLANFPLPIITAIGHERDTSVADMVAHTAVKTPTAAAEFVLRRMEGEVGRSIVYEQRLEARLSEALRESEQRYVTRANRLRQSLIGHERRQDARLNHYAQRTTHLITSAHSSARGALTPLTLRLHTSLQSVISVANGTEQMNRNRLNQALREARTHTRQIGVRLDNHGERLTLMLGKVVPEAERMLQRYKQLADVYNPEDIMRRGFVPVMRGDEPVTSVRELAPGDKLRIVLTDGSITTTIDDIQE